MVHDMNVRVKISGEFACFTRPEARVERVSYPVPTPSAARNILDSICWRPEFRWIVTAIAVLRPIRFCAFRRNEVQSKLAPAAVHRWMVDPSTFEPLLAGAGSPEATPRAGLLLKNVAYVIEARPLVYDHTGDNCEQKYVAMFNRRVANGQCYHRPVLGCREFAANFEPASERDAPISTSEDLGNMLYDIVFRPDGNRPVFFAARLEKGVMITDPEVVISDLQVREEVLKCSCRH